MKSPFIQLTLIDVVSTTLVHINVDHIVWFECCSDGTRIRTPIGAMIVKETPEVVIETINSTFEDSKPLPEVKWGG